MRDHFYLKALVIQLGKLRPLESNNLSILLIRGSQNPCLPAQHPLLWPLAFRHRALLEVELSFLVSQVAGAKGWQGTGSGEIEGSVSPPGPN